MRKRFWRNVVLIGLAHVAIFFALLHWAGETKAANAQEITWLSGAGASEAEQTEEISTPAPEPEKVEAPSPAKSEITLPAPTPTPTATARPTATPAATPRKKSSPKPSATPSKKKSVAAKTSPKKKEAVVKSAARKSLGETKSTKSSKGGSGNGASGPGSGKSDAATASYYGNMLHDRFYRAWSQPQTVVASGAKLSALARIRIEKDGRVSSFKIVRASGNVLVDESVTAVGKKVTQVDALPAGMGRGGHYDININFALNSQ